MLKLIIHVIAIAVLCSVFGTTHGLLIYICINLILRGI